MSYICKKELRVEIYDEDGWGTDKFKTVRVGDKYEAVDSKWRLAGGSDTIRLENKKGDWLELLPEIVDWHFAKRLEPSDFKVGQKAYTISKGWVVECEISKVGRKYVYVKGGWCGYYLRDEGDNFLVENKDWGHPEELFLTRKDAEERIEYSMLLTELNKKTELRKMMKLTLDQLRRINQILEEREDEK